MKIGIQGKSPGNSKLHPFLEGAVHSMRTQSTAQSWAGTGAPQDELSPGGRGERVGLGRGMMTL